MGDLRLEKRRLGSRVLRIDAISYFNGDEDGI